MRSVRSLPRRTVLTTIGAAAAAAVVPAGLATSEDGEIPCRRWSEPIPTAFVDWFARSSDTYPASVDRIVDDEFVVLLLEDGDEVVEQVDVDRGRLPSVEETDRVLVTMDDGDPESVCLVA